MLKYIRRLRRKSNFVFGRFRLILVEDQTIKNTHKLPHRRNWNHVVTGAMFVVMCTTAQEEWHASALWSHVRLLCVSWYMVPMNIKQYLYQLTVTIWTCVTGRRIQNKKTHTETRCHFGWTKTHIAFQWHWTTNSTFRCIDLHLDVSLAKNGFLLAFSSAPPENGLELEKLMNLKALSWFDVGKLLRIEFQSFYGIAVVSRSKQKPNSLFFVWQTEIKQNAKIEKWGLGKIITLRSLSNETCNMQPKPNEQRLTRNVIKP